MLRYALAVDKYVTLKVYDVLGREVAALAEGENHAGYYETLFDASYLGSGVYFYKLQAGSYSAVRKLVVVK